MKQCSNCKEWKKLSCFYKYKRSKDGLQSSCIKCQKEYAKNRYKKNPEKCIAQNKKWRNKNLEYAKLLTKKWIENNYIKCWSYRTIYNHKKVGYIVTITKDFVEKMANETTNCPLCGCKLDWEYKNCYTKESPTLDRMNNEQTMNEDNVWIICNSCNSKKNTKTLKEYKEYLNDNIKNRRSRK